ncbi:hypothetical protein GCM10029992_50180 [Glycomyces albus]
MHPDNPRLTVRRIAAIACAAILAVAFQTFAGAERAEAAPGPSFTNPVVDTPNSADPTLVYHEGYYYYVATTWSSQVLMRRSTTIAGLNSAAEQVVVNTGGNTMWAPHLEMIDGRWYLYYSVEQGDLPRRTHVAQSAGSDPMGPYTVMGVLDLMPNNGWAIDAAPMRIDGQLYMTFSAFHADGLQSNYIAPMSNPWTAAAHGSRISAPTLSWETQGGAVNEGPSPLPRREDLPDLLGQQLPGPGLQDRHARIRGWRSVAGELVVQVLRTALPTQRRRRRLRPRPPLVLHLTGRHRDLDRVPRQRLGLRRLRHHPHHPRPADLVQRRRHTESRRPGLDLHSPRRALGEPNDGRYGVEIRNRHSDLCLDDYEWGTEPGAEVRQWTCNDYSVQDWNLSPIGNGYYTISNVYSGLCLDDYEWGTEPGAEVRQWTCNGQSVQQWEVVDTGDGYVNLVNRYSGLCLDNYNFGTEPGAEVRQWTCNGGAVQDWLIS